MGGRGAACAGGYPYQFFYYSAFGETLWQHDAQTGSFAMPYKFNAKEQDPETGNYYYGARYYNPQTSIWFGVDPLAAKYPHVTPYNFVEGNPIMLIDPTGMGPTPWQKFMYRMQRMVYKVQNLFKGKEELNYLLQDVEVVANRLPDAVNLNSMGFEVSLGVKDFKFGPLGSATLDLTVFSVQRDPHTGEPNLDLFYFEAGLWLGNTNLGLQGEAGLLSASNEGTSILNGSISGGANFGEAAQASISTASGAVFHSREGFLTGRTMSEPAYDTSRLIDLGDGKLVPMLIIGGEVHLGPVKVEAELNMDALYNSITREGTGVGSEWK